MKAARRSEQQPARREQPHCAQVDVLVAAERSRHRVACLCESGRVQHDSIELGAIFFLLAKEVESVCLHEIDVGDFVESRVRARARKRLSGRIERDYLIGILSEVHRKRSVVAEAIECDALCYLACQMTVLPLVEEGPG